MKLKNSFGVRQNTIPTFYSNREHQPKRRHGSKLGSEREVKTN